MGILRSFVSLVAAAAVASASPIERRAPIDSDKVVGFAETVPSGTTGSVYLAYKPYLKVVNGCVPFPAVDAAGNTKYVSFFPLTGLAGIMRSTGSTVSCRSNALRTGSNLLAAPDLTRQAHQMASAQAVRARCTSAAPHPTVTMD